MQVVYVDSLFLINFVINYIMLLVTTKICAARTNRLRLALSAAFGAGYSVAVVLPFAFALFLASPFVKVAVGILMVLASFGGQARIIRLTLVFFAVSVAFGGAVMAASLLGGGGLYGGLLTPIDLRVLILAFAVCYVVLTLVFRRAGRVRSGGIVSLKLRHGGREVAIRALRDTGNALTDPMSGRPVIVAGVNDVTPLFPQSVRGTVAGLRLKDAVKVLEELSDTGSTVRFHLIPYSAVGTAGGMLLAFRPDEIIVDGKVKTGMLLALSPNSVSESGTYSALLGA
jgi:stage II sporulation protein GA (sporulation sigma-E factor processing peptidase)